MNKVSCTMESAAADESRAEGGERGWEGGLKTGGDCRFWTSQSGLFQDQAAPQSNSYRIKLKFIRDTIRLNILDQACWRKSSQIAKEMFILVCSADAWAKLNILKCGVCIRRIIIKVGWIHVGSLNNLVNKHWRREHWSLFGDRSWKQWCLCLL